MKNLVLKLIVIGVISSLASCSKEKKKEMRDMKDSLKTEMSNKSVVNNLSNFDISTIPFSDEDLGSFPFFKLPRGLTSEGKPVDKKMDKLFVPINKVMTPLEGHVWKTSVVTVGNEKNEWSKSYFEDSFDKAIKNAGGVKIFDGKISEEEYNRYRNSAPYLGEKGSIGHFDENIKVYVIRRKEQGNIYIQLTADKASGKLNILQQSGNPSINIVKATDLKKQIDKNGKVVLYINYETDKASLKPDGNEAVKEIVKMLQRDKGLNLTINVYTDNTGNEDHNLRLSERRAQNIKDEMVKLGVNKDRIISKGYGQQNPIADNSTKDGRALNTRVEIVKNK
ncbi:OmpA family protein [Elizabethkingia anophelis]|uniref:OmpA family protein n=1 Tax=Elizabethkingia anophelis TaxID=1117645 RepID=UPI00136A7E36|nr:OmpA family protein [Elizabethkingia anophelis]MYY25920.1 OmpA family protein [Elizabethkingia anophelis]